MIDVSWKERAACHDAPREMFFPKFGVSVATVLTAKEYCALCPVRVECEDYARKTEATDGIWGGIYFGTVRGKQRLPNLLKEKIK